MSTDRRDGHGSRLRLLPALLLSVSALNAPHAAAAPATDITQMSLEQLLDVAIIGASKYEQKQDEVAAAVSVITRDEIKAFGWRTIDEVGINMVLRQSRIAFEVNLAATRRAQLNVSSKLLRLASEVRQ